MLICEVPGHDDEEIIGLCFNNNCSAHPEFCFECRKEIHIKHDKESLRFADVNKKINEIQNTFGLQKAAIEECLQKIKECFEEYLQSHFLKWIDECSKLKALIDNKEYEQVKNHYKNYLYYIKFDFDAIRQQILDIEQLSEQFIQSLQLIKSKEINQSDQFNQIEESKILVPFINFESNQVNSQNLTNHNNIQQSSYLQNSEYLDNKFLFMDNNSNKFLDNSEVFDNNPLLMDNNQNQFLSKPPQQVNPQFQHEIPKNYNQQGNQDENDEVLYQLQLNEVKFRESEESIQFTKQAKQNMSNLKLALNLIEQALAKQENNGEAYFVKGQILMKQEKFDESLSSFKKCQQITPENKELYICIASVLSNMNRLAEAEKAYEEAIKFNPNISQLYSNRAGVLNSLHRYNDAVNMCDKAISLDNTNASAYNNKGYALTYLNKLDEALQYLNLATQHGKDNSDFWGNKGKLLLKQNKFSEAKYCLEQVEKLGCQTANCFNFKSQMLFQQGQLQAALNVCNQGIQFYPQDSKLLELKQMLQNGGYKRSNLTG